MNQARNPEWLRALFRYQAQRRTAGQVPIDIEVIKSVAALVLAEQRPSTVRVALETRTLIPEKTVSRHLATMNTLGVLHPRGAGWTTGAPATWQGYSSAAPDPDGIERHVELFLRDINERIADLERRLPKEKNDVADRAGRSGAHEKAPMSDGGSGGQGRT